jgi:hypothetical protein
MARANEKKPSDRTKNIVSINLYLINSFGKYTKKCLVLLELTIPVWAGNTKNIPRLSRGIFCKKLFYYGVAGAVAGAVGDGLPIFTGATSIILFRVGLYIYALRAAV